MSPRVQLDQDFTDRQAVIDLRALGRNLNRLKRLAGPAKVLAVVKADAYGHGLVPCARRLVAEGAAAIGVGRLEEVEALRRAGLGVPVVILTGVLPQEAAKAVRLRSIPFVFDLETAQALAETARAMGRSAEVLVKVDTGMGRLGFDLAELSSLAATLKATPGLTVRGLASHLARADEVDKASALAQVERFRAAVALFREGGFDLDLNTLANSAGAVDIQEARHDLVRPGLALYGADPGPGTKAATEPVMTVKTRLLQIREVPAGTPLSYGGTFVTARPSRIGVVALGYGHGLPRALSNPNRPGPTGRPVASFLVAGRRAPLVGRVCMNLTLLDLTEILPAARGDEVVVLGRQGEATVRAEEIAEAAGSIAYEVLCTLGGLNPRVYLDLP